MTKRTPGIFLTAVTALAVGSQSPKPCEPMDALCRFEQAANLHTHQDSPSPPLTGSNWAVIRTATGEATAT